MICDALYPLLCSRAINLVCMVAGQRGDAFHICYNRSYVDVLLVLPLTCQFDISYVFAKLQTDILDVCHVAHRLDPYSMPQSGALRGRSLLLQVLRMIIGRVQGLPMARTPHPRTIYLSSRCEHYYLRQPLFVDIFPNYKVCFLPFDCSS